MILWKLCDDISNGSIILTDKQTRQTDTTENNTTFATQVLNINTSSSGNDSNDNK